MSEIEERIVWSPQPGAQEMLVHCPITLIGFGGARGGGKTDGVLGKFAILQQQLGESFNAIFFRKELPQADDLIERAKQIYLPLRAHWQDQKKQFTFPNGARLRFRPLGDDSDAEKYQGQNLSHAAVEEAGNYGDPSPIWKLFGALRGKGKGQVVLTFNPGGVGHHWLKELFIRPAPMGKKILTKVLPNGASFDYIYIPSRIADNQILLAQDPEYINRLHMVGSPELVRAWLEGDFEIHEGSYFPEFSSRHIIQPFNVPKHWPRYLGYDWGFRSPFAAVWGAVSSGRDDYGNEVPYPKGAIIIYREMWGKGVDNVEQANRIAAASVGENVHAAADPSIFNTQGGPSIADQFHTVFAKYKHPNFRPADNDRLSGWAQIRQRLVAKPALLYIFANCPYLLETLPSMTIDKKKPEDLDTSGNDHVCLTGDTLVITDSGPLPIKDLCGNFSGFVLSHNGYYQEACGALTRKAAKVITLTFDDDTQVTCTPDHRFMLADGTFKKACLLTYSDLMQCVTSELQNVRSPKTVKSIVESETPQDVYCLNVPETSTFVLANGIVSHNCDALRYLCKERLIDSKWEQPAEVFNKGIIRLQAYIAQMRAQRGRPTI